MIYLLLYEIKLARKQKKSKTHLADSFPEGLIERSSGKDDGGEAGGARDFVVKEGALAAGLANVGDAMQRLRPPLVLGQADPLHACGRVSELLGLLLQRHSVHQVLHPNLEGQ